MNEKASIPLLIEKLSELRREMLREEDAISATLKQVRKEHRQSARNLAHYIALRRYDIRELQEELAAHGLSSLGRTEADVLGAVDAVLGVLTWLQGKSAVQEPQNNGTEIRGWALLERNTESLLGPSSGKRNVRIMVTMPSDAAFDYGLVRDLVVNGMNVMRVNCAHDGPEQWAAMISNLRKAQAETGRQCRIHMDLGGPKLRTGGLQDGPAVLKYRPNRDAYGRVISPARIFLTSARQPEASSAQADACVPVPASWLAKLRPADRIAFKDARGASRSMLVKEIDGKNRWAEGDRTAYLVPGMVLEAIYSKTSPYSGKKSQARLGEIPPKAQGIILRRGDTLLMLRSSVSGRPAIYDQQGRLLSPAIIGVAQPEFLDHVLVGEKIKLDDGKIGGIIRAIDPDKITVEIVQARAKGSTLRAEKGINLPESELRVSPLTVDDITALNFVAKNADLVGYSFVRTASDVRDL
ncbi:MAG TPA: pyruvate kinase, partial [Terriglobales bacterium]